MNKRYEFNLGFKDKVSELVFDTFFFSLFAGFLVWDLGQGRFWSATFDVVVLVWGYLNLKTTAQQVRAAHGTPTN